MIFDSIINIFREKVEVDNKQNWISERLNDLEIHRDNFDTLPFKIVELKNYGFLTKVLGLYAFIPFNYMPWSYSDINSWIAIAPTLFDKKFFCKIHELDKDKPSVILNAELPQFKKAELLNGEEYKGIVVKISDYGLFVDIGYHFGWRCGSLVGLLHKTQLNKNAEICNFSLGQEITTIYLGMNDNGQPLFSNDRVRTDWQLGKPQELIGQITWVEAARPIKSKTVDLFVKGIYKADLVLDKQVYPPKIRKRILTLKNELSHGEIIFCKVTGLNRRSKTLKIDWHKVVETEIFDGSSILNNLDDNTIEKLITLKNDMTTQMIEN